MRDRKGKRHISPIPVTLPAILLIMLCIITYIPRRIYADAKGDGKTSKDKMDVEILRDDGLRVLTGEDSVYYCNMGLLFILHGAEAGYYEYSLTREPDKGSSGYRRMTGDSFRLAKRDPGSGNRIWRLSFRQLDGSHNVVSRSGTFLIRFDTKKPAAGLSFEKKGPFEDPVVIRLSLKDHGSGLKYAELRQEGELLYRNNFSGIDLTENDKEVLILRRRRELSGKELRLFVLDRAGNDRLVECSFPQTEVTDSLRAGPVLYALKALSGGQKPGNDTILAGIIVALLMLTGLFGELVRYCLKRYPQENRLLPGNRE